MVGVGLLLAATTGESFAALPLVLRRVGVAVGAEVEFVATWAGRGSPAAGAACGLAAACRRVAVDAAATSVAAAEAVLGAAGASAACATAGRLGAPLWRVRVGVAVG